MITLKCHMGCKRNAWLTWKTTVVFPVQTRQSQLYGLEEGPAGYDHSCSGAIFITSSYHGTLASSQGQADPRSTIPIIASIYRYSGGHRWVLWCIQRTNSQWKYRAQYAGVGSLVMVLVTIQHGFDGHKSPQRPVGSVLGVQYTGSGLLYARRFWNHHLHCFAGLSSYFFVYCTYKTC